MAIAARFCFCRATALRVARTASAHRLRRLLRGKPSGKLPKFRSNSRSLDQTPENGLLCKGVGKFAPLPLSSAALLFILSSVSTDRRSCMVFRRYLRHCRGTSAFPLKNNADLFSRIPNVLTRACSCCDSYKVYYLAEMDTGEVQLLRLADSTDRVVSVCSEDRAVAQHVLQIRHCELRLATCVRANNTIASTRMCSVCRRDRQENSSTRSWEST